MSNYPPGVSGSTYGAPWNDIDISEDIEITLRIGIEYSIAGPASEEDIQDDKELIRGLVVDEVCKTIMKGTYDNAEVVSCEIIK